MSLPFLKYEIMRIKFVLNENFSMEIHKNGLVWFMAINTYFFRSTRTRSCITRKI